jgi:hypothetical protein
MNKFEYALPENITDVFNYLQEPDSVIKAGGVDLVDLMKEGILQPKRLVNPVTSVSVPGVGTSAVMTSHVHVKAAMSVMRSKIRTSPRKSRKKLPKKR